MERKQYDLPWILSESLTDPQAKKVAEDLSYYEVKELVERIIERLPKGLAWRHYTFDSPRIACILSNCGELTILMVTVQSAWCRNMVIP